MHFIGILDLILWICWSHLPSFGVIALSASVTMGTAVIFTFHIIFCSTFSILFLRFLMFLLADVAFTWYSYREHYSPLPLVVYHHYVHLVNHQQVFCIWKSHSIFAWSFVGLRDHILTLGSQSSGLIGQDYFESTQRNSHLNHNKSDNTFLKCPKVKSLLNHLTHHRDLKKDFPLFSVKAHL